MNSHEVNREGRRHVKAELRRRGAGDLTSHGTRKISLRATNSNRSRTVELQVKTKRKGNWQTSITELDVKDVRDFWVFVDLSGPPRYWIVPARWMRDDIDEAHRRYLAKHGGQRPKTKGSTHHSIAESRLEGWQDRWDILGIF